MSERNVKLYLEDIDSAISSITAYTRDMSYTAFLALRYFEWVNGNQKWGLIAPTPPHEDRPAAPDGAPPRRFNWLTFLMTEILVRWDNLDYLVCW